MDDSQYPAISAGFGSGKTHHFITKAFRAMEQNAGLMTATSPALLMEPTYPMVEDILLPQFRDRLDLYGIPHTYNSKGHRLIIPSWLGGKPAHILFLSGENYNRYRGFNTPFFGVDEVDTIKVAKARQMWIILTSRLRVTNSTQQGFVSSTPEGFRFLWSKWDPSKLDTDYKRWKYTLHRASSRDNYHNPPEYLETLIENYDTRLISAYVDGYFVNLTQGSIYEMFRMEHHVNDAVSYNPNRQLHLFFDFNVNPMTAGAAHIVTPEGRPPEIRVFDEFVQHTSNTRNVCNTIIEDYGDHKGPVIVYGDATGKNLHSSGSAGKSDIKIIDEVIGSHFMKRGGYLNRFTTSNPLKRDRYASTNAMFLNGKGQRRIFAHSRCKTLIADWIAMSYKEGSNEPDTQKETIGHISSAFDYFVFYHWPEKHRRRARQGRAA